MAKKSKLPDVSEITKIAGKFIGDIKKSITEIVTDYKTARKDTSTEAKEQQPESSIKTEDTSSQKEEEKKSEENR